jgi:RHS repeat-associated protein
VTDPLTDKTIFTYDTNSDLLSATNPKGKTTTFSYDSHGNLTGIQDALSDKTTLGYDSFGQLTSKTDATGNTTNFTYSGLGDLTGVRDALGNSTTLAYDIDGRLTSVTDPNLHTATSVYDSLGRLTNASDALGDKTGFTYDGVGNLLSVTDANGHTTGYAYDAVNNLLTVTDALGHVTKYSYDADNNRTAFTNAKGNGTTYQYDAVNRLIGTADPLSFTTAYSYDPAGNVAAVTDAKGQTNRFAYDALNRLLSIAYADGKNVAYSYDADGNRASMADWTGTTSYQYDALDRLTSVAFPASKSVSYSYDANGHRASLTYPDSKVVEYGFDADERLSTVTDWLSHVTKYSYDAAGNLASALYPNKAGIKFAYDPANRLTSVVNNTVGLPPLVFSYTLDPVGNRTVVTEAGIPTNYGYDALNELTSAQLWFLKTTWTYDPVGNRLRQASPFGVTNYSYDASDRLLKAGTRTFAYDADGNETSVTDSIPYAKHTYTWNAANRLVSVDGGLTDSFVYDGDGNRVSQSGAGQTQNYVNDKAAALPVVLQDAYSRGSPSTYVYGLNLIETFQGSDNDFYQYDGLGSVIQLTNAAGIPEMSYFYDAWGNAILPAPPNNPFRFVGQAFDTGTGLYYLRARYYDSSAARFISADLFKGNPTNPMSMNSYRYADQNPLRYTDPLGLSSFDTTSTQPNLNLTANAASTASSILEPVIGFTAEAFGILKLGLSGLGDVFDAATGLWKVKQATDLLDQVNQVDEFYATATPAQQEIINDAITTVPGHPTWSSLTEQQKQDNLTMVETNLCGTPSMCVLGQAVHQGIIP